MKQITIFLSLLLLLQGCIPFPTGSNIRTVTVRSISNDTVVFYGTKKKFILEKGTHVVVGETFLSTIIKNSTLKDLAVIRKLK